MADISSALPQAANYTGMQVQPDPVGSFLKAANLNAQTGLLGAQTQQTQAQSALTGINVARQQAYPAMLQQVLQNPTPSNFSALTAMFPDQHAAITSSFDMNQLAQRQAVIQPMAQAYSAMLNGRPDLALGIVQQQRDALVNSNPNTNDPAVQQKLQHADTLISQIQNDPKAATGLMGATLSSVLPPNEFAQMFGSFMTTPATVGTANANASIAQAKASTAPAQAMADLGLTQAQTRNIGSEIDNRAAQFGLQQQEFHTNVALKLRELDYAQNVPNMRGNTAEIVNSSAMDSVQHGMQADRIQSALSNIDSLKQQGRWTTGVLADMRARGQSVTGSQDDWNSLRTEYNSLRNGSIFSTVQGGRTTDADLRVLQQGFPDANANPAQIETFLNSMRNVELRQARADEGKAAWGSAFGYMGPATHDATVGGQQVAKGTSYADFSKTRLATLATTPSAFAAPTAGPGVQVNNPSAQQPQGQPAPGQQPPGQAYPSTLSGPLARYNRYLTGH
ncbi:hypothetical protein [Ralstonia insidiosa]|uniref:hypothetical protein n=1 Tax=Ralstonia insidiosa TaxID=190721 RepID=UPI000CEF5959|nr:hypothetical protein [Ralstonia insidiosa]